ncbi:MAG: hypothetical protein LBM61_05035 [Prevotellaceae bacterium]|nr:hypothetical protein [Prevotellaceae bacterium]
MKITKSVSSTTKPHNLTASQDSLTSGFGSLTPQVYTIITGELCATPQALNLRNPMQAERSDAQLGVVNVSLTTTPAGVEPTSGFSGWGTPVLRVSPAVTQIERLRRSARLLHTLVVCLWRSATPAILYSDSTFWTYHNKPISYNDEEIPFLGRPVPVRPDGCLYRD